MSLKIMTDIYQKSIFISEMNQHALSVSKPSQFVSFLAFFKLSHIETNATARKILKFVTKGEKNASLWLWNQKPLIRIQWNSKIQHYHFYQLSPFFKCVLASLLKADGFSNQNPKVNGRVKRVLSTRAHQTV